MRKRLMQFYWHHSEEVGGILWCVVIAMILTGMVMVYGILPR